MNQTQIIGQISSDPVHLSSRVHSRKQGSSAQQVLWKDLHHMLPSNGGQSGILGSVGPVAALCQQVVAHVQQCGGPGVRLLAGSFCRLCCCGISCRGQLCWHCIRNIAVSCQQLPALQTSTLRPGGCGCSKSLVMAMVETRPEQVGYVTVWST